MIKRLLIFLIVCGFTGTVKAVTRITCIGASITCGATLPNPQRQSVSAQLQMMLGKNFEVSNFGVSSATMLKKGDKVAQIVSGRFPMLYLFADEDDAVSPANNTLLFEQKVKALGGAITVIHKPGFKHHRHSLPNPAPIVDFILKATGYYISAPAITTQ